MTNDQIVLIQISFEKVSPRAEAVAALFYERLFEIAPEIKKLFKTDMTAQGHKLMQMLDVVVANLSDLETVIPAIRELAIRHTGYGVTSEYYPFVGEALIWSLKKALDQDFTLAMEDAWAEAYLLLASTMISAAEAA